MSVSPGTAGSGESRESHWYAGRTLVQLSQAHDAAAASFVRHRLCATLVPPYGLEFTARMTLQRKRMQEGRALSVLATLGSIALEPVRRCLVYELTPIEDDADDDRAAEGAPPSSPSQSPTLLRLPLTKGTVDKAVFRDRQGER